MRIKQRTLTIGFVATDLVLVSALAAYWYWSPLSALESMRAALVERNVEAFNAHVDYARVRPSLEAHFSDLMQGTDSPAATGSNEPVRFNMAAALGVSGAAEAANAAVKPDTLMNLMLAAQPGEPAEPGTVRAARSRLLAATQDVASLQQMLAMYRGVYGDFPTQEQGLAALASTPTVGGTQRRALLDKLPTDPWGRPYVYLRAGTSVAVNFLPPPAPPAMPAQHSATLIAERQGASRMLVEYTTGGDPARSIWLTMEREGFADWRVVQAKIPR